MKYKVEQKIYIYNKRFIFSYSWKILTRVLKKTPFLSTEYTSPFTFYFTVQ